MLILEYINMQNIEDLIKQIVSSPLFKNQLQAQFKQCIQLRDQPYAPASDVVALPQLVEQINSYITEITEIALEEENSKNYITFMKKNQQLCNELEKRINIRIASSAQEVNLKIETINLKLNELAKTSKRGGCEPYKLRDQRKMITQSILETSRIQNSPKTLSTIRIKPYVSFGKTVNSSEELCEMSDTNSSLQAELEKAKLMEIEKQCKRCLQTWWTKVENALEGLKKEQEKLNVVCTEMSQKAEMKLQGNLQSLWNVISDLCSRISKFESMELLYPPAQL